MKRVFGYIVFVVFLIALALAGWAYPDLFKELDE